MKRFLLFLLLVSLVITIGYLPVTATNDLADEIKEAKILNAYWVGDYQVPAFSSLKRNSFLIEIKFSEDNPSDVQIQNFFTKAGYHFQLKTKGQKSLSAIGYQYGNYKINDQNITGLWLFVDSKEIVNIKTDIPYELIPQKKNKKFRWIIKNKIIFRNLSEVKFSTYKDPITEFLSRGEPFGPKAVETIPFSFVNGFIIINARINNSEKEYRFIVDTGAGSIVIDDEVAAELKLEKKMDGRASDYYDSKAFDIVFIRRLTVGKVGVENCGAIVIDLKLLDDYQVDGLIGYNFLKFYNIEINYERQLISFARENILPPQSGLKVDLYLKSNRQITAELIMGTIRTEAIIDTGFTSKTYLLIPLKLIDEYQSILSCEPIKAKGNVVTSIIGHSVGMIAKVNSMKLGDFYTENLPVTLDNGNSIVIGSKFLSCFNVIFDYPAMKMYLTPIDSRKMATNIFSYGFGSGKDKTGKIRIYTIFKGSPADLSGLVVGDEIRKIYNQTNIELTYEELLNLLDSENDQTIKLLISNHTGEREVVLNKTMLLPE